MSSARAAVTVFLPTWNGGARLEEVLEAVASQRTQRRVILRATDSSSTDGTREVLERHGVAVTRIAQADFDHGRTRGQAVLSSETELVVLLTQDARPQDEHWLEELLAPFEDATVAGAWSRQVPRPGCHPFQRANLAVHANAAGERQVVEPVSAAQWQRLTPFDRLARLGFDDVASAVRRSVVERVPFPSTAFGEDMEWARDVLLAGHRLVFATRSCVEHSHDLTYAELTKRVALTHALRRRLTDLDPFPTRSAAAIGVYFAARFYLRTALRAPDLTFATRARSAFQALPYAYLQITSARRGARSTTYRAPKPPIT